MHELTNETMNTTQIKALTCHDRQVWNDVIKENSEIYFYLPRTKRDKLSLKWTASVQIIKEKHPSHLIEYQKQVQMVTKLTTRKKYRRTEQNQSNIHNEQSNTLIVDNKSSEESEEEKITIPRYNNRHNLRQDIRLSQRYGNAYTYLADICHKQLVLEN